MFSVKKVMGAELSKEDLDMLARNSGFSKEEIKEWYKGFKQDNTDGKLDEEEFKRIFNELFSNTFYKKCPNGNMDAFSRHIFRTWDRDNSGQMDFKEFLTAVDVMCNGSAKAKLTWAFRLYDVNGNGTIEEKEMESLIHAVYEMMGGKMKYARPHAKEIFKTMDKDKDHMVTKEEFVKACIADKEIYLLLTNAME